MNNYLYAITKNDWIIAKREDDQPVLCEIVTEHGLSRWHPTAMPYVPEEGQSPETLDFLPIEKHTQIALVTIAGDVAFQSEIPIQFAAIRARPKAAKVDEPIITTMASQEPEVLDCTLDDPPFVISEPDPQPLCQDTEQTLAPLPSSQE